ncbi:hypothetical protein DFQ27_000836, partial [Actinomortierella ambigua]
MPAFVKQFGYTCNENAHDDFAALLTSTEIPLRARQELQRNYDIWRRNRGMEFWSSVSASLQEPQRTRALLNWVMSPHLRAVKPVPALLMSNCLRKLLSIKPKLHQKPATIQMCVLFYTMSKEDKLPEQLETILGKRDRDQDELGEKANMSALFDTPIQLDDDIQRLSTDKGHHVQEDSNINKRAAHLDSPFHNKGAHHDDDRENEEDEDAVTIVMEQGHHPLNIVFDYEAFTFSCIIAGYDISEPFNDYYEEAITVPYDDTSFQDFLKEPTQMQRRQFGEHYETLREALLKMMKLKNHAPAFEDEEDDAVAFCQAAHN